MARLYARIFEHANYGGQHRDLTGDVDSFGSIGFNDKVSSIIVYRGNQYQVGDVARFHQHAHYSGGYLDLAPGYYANIHVQPYSFGDKISSVNFLPVESNSHNLSVRLWIRVYEHVNYGGQYRDILASKSNFHHLGFNDKVSSLRVMAGEDYAPGWVCDFYQHKDYGGGQLQPGSFGPGTSIPNIKEAPYQFNDVISSVRVRHH